MAMKKVLTLLVLLGLCSFSAFAQKTERNAASPGLKGLALDTLPRLTLPAIPDSISERLSPFFPPSTLDLPDFNGLDLSLRRELKHTTVQEARVQEMPVFKPEGNYASRIFTPDSTRHYTLLIKEY